MERETGVLVAAAVAWGVIIGTVIGLVIAKPKPNKDK